MWRNGKKINQIIILVIIISFLFIYLYWLSIIAPSIKDDSTADSSIEKFIVPIEDWPQSFPENPKVKDILRPIPTFKPTLLPPFEDKGRPRNIDLSIHWHPLRLFLLFFSWDLLQYICDQTNSYAYRNNEATDPWRSISPIELLHFLGCLIIIGLFNQPPRKYLWNQRGGCLRGTPISKNRFEQIVKYIHFNDRGPNPVSNQPWWSKLDYVLSIIIIIILP